MNTHWAVDFGTTNTLIAKWVGTHATTIALDELVEYEPAWQTPLVPSIVYFQQDTNRAIIGKPALAAREIMRESDTFIMGPMARSFKKTLAQGSQRPVAQVGMESISARNCATVFLKELLNHAAEYERLRSSPKKTPAQMLKRLLYWWRKEGQVTDLTMTVPVDSFEAYRAELAHIARKLGVSRFQVLDEPVAAALGYGIDISEEKNLLVIDFGGGTLDIAVVRTLPHAPGSRDTNRRHAQVLAARGMTFGGETIDGWITDLGCEKLNAHQSTLRPVFMAQAETIKKDLSNKVNIAESSYFVLPGTGRIEISRQEFLAMLETRGLYRTLDTITNATLDDCSRQIHISQIDAVLLVGGSTLLPGVRDLFEQNFGADRVHYWEPFEAVVKGAAIFGAGYSVDQIVHHDYSIRVYNDGQQRPEYERLIRRGTSYPTPVPFETRYYSVTENQTQFRLPICEVGYAGRTALPWMRRMNGNEYWLPSEVEESECIVVMNQGDVIKLAPPGSGTQARLRIDFAIDEERWLIATVHDLLKQRDIITADQVTKLR